MKQTYSSFFPQIVLIWILWFFHGSLISQEPRVFTTDDFELRGPVMTCKVVTDYGKEEFEFNPEGYLTKLVTRFNDNDYSVTYYKYQGKYIAEKRYENYIEGSFDEATSIAHFYTTDTTDNRKITEKILSYTKEFLDQYEYSYDTEGKLSKIVHSNADGLDETLIEYSQYKGESTTSYLLNGVMLKSIRTSRKKSGQPSERKVVLTKEFLNGDPVKAMEQTFDTKGLLRSVTVFQYDREKKSFAESKFSEYFYDEKDILIKIVQTLGKSKSSQEFIYQFDDETKGNWIKKIITPENEYTTRIIEYYEEEQGED